MIRKSRKQLPELWYLCRHHTRIYALKLKLSKRQVLYLSRLQQWMWTWLNLFMEWLTIAPYPLVAEALPSMLVLGADLKKEAWSYFCFCFYLHDQSSKTTDECQIWLSDNSKWEWNHFKQNKSKIQRRLKKAKRTMKRTEQIQRTNKTHVIIGRAKNPKSNNW